MNKETLKEFLCWMVDKEYIQLVHSHLVGSHLLGSQAIHLSKTIRDIEMEFYQEIRDKKLNDILK
jgi:hypothetical protein